MNINQAQILFLLLMLINGFAPHTAEAQYRQKKSKQKSLFGIRTIVGLNMTQMDGDRTTGYKKAGISTGIEGLINLSDQVQIGVGFVFDQRGSKTQQVFTTFASNNGNKLKRDLTIGLNYVMTPITFNYRFKEGLKTDYIYAIHLGIAYGRLINSTFTELPSFSTNSNDIVFEALQDDFNSNDLSFVFGLGVYLSKRIELSIYHLASFFPLYEQEQDVKIKLRLYHLRLGISYSFD